MSCAACAIRLRKPRLGPHERQQNLRGAFAFASARQLRRLREAAHVAIVDDVMTTGSTANELRGLLSAAGISQVEVWAVARAS